ncbi:MAG: potassium transporter TrkG [Chloroflexota bacterium]
MTRYLDNDVRAREGFAIVTFGWISAAFFGSLPFYISGSIPAFTDAFFETMSGFSTTGGTILNDIEALPHGLLFWRSFTHWLGGMGIIVMSLAILPFLGVGGMQLFKAEIPGPVADKLTPRVTQTAKLLWLVYLVISAAEVILLILGGMDFFEALTHTFGTMATGGYSIKNASIGAYDSAYIDYVIIFFMIIAGSNFALHYRLMTGNFRAYFQNTEFKVFLGIIAGATLIISFDTFFLYDSLAETVQKTLFQVVAIITTTGYGTADYEQWALSSQFILFVLMFIGGSAGSTSGGMKVMRIYLMIKFVFVEIKRLLHPHAVIPVRMDGVTVPREVILNIVSYFGLFMMIYVASVFAMILLGMNLPTAFGVVAATLNSIGPGLADVGPTDNYAHIPAIGKWLLSFLMLLGRLEIFTVMILFSPAYWRK